jgi:hypothetical protein
MLSVISSSTECPRCFPTEPSASEQNTDPTRQPVVSARLAWQRARSAVSREWSMQGPIQNQGMTDQLMTEQVTLPPYSSAAH